MTANTKTNSQETERKGFIARLNNLSIRNKIIGIAILVFLVLLIVSIPGDRGEMMTRQERVEAAQIAYDLALPPVGPVMNRVNEFIDGIGVDLSDNRVYTRLPTALSTFNRNDVSIASQFQAVVTFHDNVHNLLEGTNAVAELDTEEFQALVLEMDTTMSVSWLALMELNTSVDEYNGYRQWLSAKLTGAILGLPPSYTDPVPYNSRLVRNTSLELEQ